MLKSGSHWRPSMLKSAVTLMTIDVEVGVTLITIDVEVGRYIDEHQCWCLQMNWWPSMLHNRNYFVHIENDHLCHNDLFPSPQQNQPIHLVATPHCFNRYCTICRFVSCLLDIACSMINYALVYIYCVTFVDGFFSGLKKIFIFIAYSVAFDFVCRSDCYRIFCRKGSRVIEKSWFIIFVII